MKTKFKFRMLRDQHFVQYAEDIDDDDAEAEQQNQDDILQMMTNLHEQDENNREQYHKAELDRSRNANIKEILQSMKDAGSGKKDSPTSREAAASNVSKLYYSTKEFGSREEATKYRQENVYAGDAVAMPNSAMMLNQESRVREGAKSLVMKKPQGRKLAQKKGTSGTGRMVGFENPREAMGKERGNQTEHRMDLRNLVNMSMITGANDDSFNAESQKRVYVSQKEPKIPRGAMAGGASLPKNANVSGTNGIQFLMAQTEKFSRGVRQGSSKMSAEESRGLNRGASGASKPSLKLETRSQRGATATSHAEQPRRRETDMSMNQWQGTQGPYADSVAVDSVGGSRDGAKQVRPRHNNNLSSAARMSIVATAARLDSSLQPAPQTKFKEKVMGGTQKLSYLLSSSQMAGLDDELQPQKVIKNDHSQKFQPASVAAQKPLLYVVGNDGVAHQPIVDKRKVVRNSTSQMSSQPQMLIAAGNSSKKSLNFNLDELRDSLVHGDQYGQQVNPPVRSGALIEQQQKAAAKNKQFKIQSLSQQRKQKRDQSGGQSAVSREQHPYRVIKCKQINFKQDAANTQQIKFSGSQANSAMGHMTATKVSSLEKRPIDMANHLSQGSTANLAQRLSQERRVDTSGPVDTLVGGAYHARHLSTNLSHDASNYSGSTGAVSANAAAKRGAAIDKNATMNIYQSGYVESIPQAMFGASQQLKNPARASGVGLGDGSGQKQRVKSRKTIGQKAYLGQEQALMRQRASSEEDQEMETAKLLSLSSSQLMNRGGGGSRLDRQESLEKKKRQTKARVNKKVVAQAASRADKIRLDIPGEQRELMTFAGGMPQTQQARNYNIDELVKDQDFQDAIQGSFGEADEERLLLGMLDGRADASGLSSLTATKADLKKARVSGVQSQMVRQQLQRTADLVRIAEMQDPRGDSLDTRPDLGRANNQSREAQQRASAGAHQTGSRAVQQEYAQVVPSEEVRTTSQTQKHFSVKASAVSGHQTRSGSRQVGKRVPVVRNPKLSLRQPDSQGSSPTSQDNIYLEQAREKQNSLLSQTTKGISKRGDRFFNQSKNFKVNQVQKASLSGGKSTKGKAQQLFNAKQEAVASVPATQSREGATNTAAIYRAIQNEKPKRSTRQSINVRKKEVVVARNTTENFASQEHTEALEALLLSKTPASNTSKVSTGVGKKKDKRLRVQGKWPGQQRIVWTAESEVMNASAPLNIKSMRSQERQQLPTYGEEAGNNDAAVLRLMNTQNVRGTLELAKVAKAKQISCSSEEQIKVGGRQVEQEAYAIGDFQQDLVEAADEEINKLYQQHAMRDSSLHSREETKLESYGDRKLIETQPVNYFQQRRKSSQSQFNLVQRQSKHSQDQRDSMAYSEYDQTNRLQLGRQRPETYAGATPEEALLGQNLEPIASGRAGGVRVGTIGSHRSKKGAASSRLTLGTNGPETVQKRQASALGAQTHSRQVPSLLNQQADTGAATVERANVIPVQRRGNKLPANSQQAVTMSQIKIKSKALAGVTTLEKQAYVPIANKMARPVVVNNTDSRLSNQNVPRPRVGSTGSHKNRQNQSVKARPKHTVKKPAAISSSQQPGTETATLLNQTQPLQLVLLEKRVVDGGRGVLEQRSAGVHEMIGEGKELGVVQGHLEYQNFTDQIIDGPDEEELRPKAAEKRKMQSRRLSSQLSQQPQTQKQRPTSHAEVGKKVSVSRRKNSTSRQRGGGVQVTAKGKEQRAVKQKVNAKVGASVNVRRSVSVKSQISQEAEPGNEKGYAKQQPQMLAAEIDSSDGRQALFRQLNASQKIVIAGANSGMVKMKREPPVATTTVNPINKLSQVKVQMSATQNLPRDNTSASKRQAQSMPRKLGNFNANQAALLKTLMSQLQKNKAKKKLMKTAQSSNLQENLRGIQRGLRDETRKACGSAFGMSAAYSGKGSALAGTLKAGKAVSGERADGSVDEEDGGDLVLGSIGKESDKSAMEGTQTGEFHIINIQRTKDEFYQVQKLAQPEAIANGDDSLVDPPPLEIDSGGSPVKRLRDDEASDQYGLKPAVEAAPKTPIVEHPIEMPKIESANTNAENHLKQFKDELDERMNLRFRTNDKHTEAQSQSQNNNMILIDHNSAYNPESGDVEESGGTTTSRVQNYSFGRQIGEGAYAVVRMATSRDDGNKYAVKIYDKEKLSDINRQRGVRREVVLLQKMNHPNIVKLIEAFETDSHVYLVMENVSGGSLHSYLKEMINKQLDEEEARRIFKQVLIALKYCHGKCIAHRDIKLENVLLDSEKNVKLIDFGFSTCIPNHKKIRMFCGTPSYMAPQIVSKVDYAGPPADIWASGVLLYALLNGCFPFRGATDDDLYRRIKRGTYQIYNQRVTQEYLDILQRCLDVNDDTRPSATDLLDDAWFGVEDLRKRAYEQEKKAFKAKILAKVPIIKKTNHTICILAQNMSDVNPANQNAGAGAANNPPAAQGQGHQGQVAQQEEVKQSNAAPYQVANAESNGNDYKDSGDDQRAHQNDQQVTVIEGNTQVSIVPRENFPRTINLNQAPALPGMQNLQINQQQQQQQAANQNQGGAIVLQYGAAVAPQIQIKYSVLIGKGDSKQKAKLNHEAYQAYYNTSCVNQDPKAYFPPSRLGNQSPPSTTSPVAQNSPLPKNKE